MENFSQLLQQGAAHAWLFIPTAVALGALHGLEPGHSKTMMAAFIIAVRGTILQAVLLGLSAAFSHTLVIWLLAAAALNYGSHWTAEASEPYFQLASGCMIACLAVWMFWRTRRDVRAASEHEHAQEHEHEHEHHNHRHDHEHPPGADYEDAHERAHAMEIQERFRNRRVTTGQIMLFGLSGGLLPCPAAFSILLICLQLKEVTLGFSLVAAFSVGLAITLVASGSAAAWSMRHAEKRFRGFGRFARHLPYLSSAFLLIIAIYMGVHGWLGITAAREIPRALPTVIPSLSLRSR